MRSPLCSLEQFPAIRDEASSIAAVLDLVRTQDEWGEGARSA